MAFLFFEEKIYIYTGIDLDIDYELTYSTYFISYIYFFPLY